MFQALSRRAKFVLFVLLGLLMTSQQPLIAQHMGDAYSIMSAPNQNLVLDVELEDRQYVLGEPVWVRCSIKKFRELFPNSPLRLP